LPRSICTTPSHARKCHQHHYCVHVLDDHHALPSASPPNHANTDSGTGQKLTECSAAINRLPPYLICAARRQDHRLWSTFNARTTSEQCKQNDENDEKPLACRSHRNVVSDPRDDMQYQVIWALHTYPKPGGYMSSVCLI
jgi:hypothetical protein